MNHTSLKTYIDYVRRRLQRAGLKGLELIEKMKNILLIIILIPMSGFASDKFSDNFGRLKNYITCTLDEAKLVAKSNVNIELFELAGNCEENSIDITN